MAMQEMIKQVFVECRDKGRLFLKLFKKYFDEQEKNWLSIIKELCINIEKIKLERSFILNKFVDKRSNLLDNYFLKDHLQDTLHSKEITQDNIFKHKRIINELIGFINREEDERYLIEVQMKNLEKDVKDIIYNWDLIRSN